MNHSCAPYATISLGFRQIPGVAESRLFVFHVSCANTLAAIVEEYSMSSQIQASAVWRKPPHGELSRVRLTPKAEVSLNLNLLSSHDK